jgi:hypothetical protein
MSKWASGTLCAVLLVIALSAIASPALAGNGHGNGNGNGNSNAASDATQPQQATPPGNSGSAPGQEKKDGQDAKSDHGNGAPPSASSAQSAGQPEGVKPSNSTEKNTNAPAGSNRTKKYGNGKTAGQIAIQHGYASSGNLHGPGNSQPHKVTTCGHRHAVDVHALKSHSGRSCGTSDGPPPRHVTEPPTPSEPPVVPVAPHDPSTPPSEPTHHGGQSSTAVARVRAGGAESGALGTTVEAATLPFTGFPLWAAVLAAAVLVGTGLILRRLARARS